MDETKEWFDQFPASPMSAAYELKAALQARDRWSARALAAEEWGAKTLTRAELAEARSVQMEVARDAVASERAKALAIVVAVTKALADLRNDEMSDLEHYHLDSRFREFAKRVRAALSDPGPPR